jgi:hypothetical protein
MLIKGGKIIINALLCQLIALNIKYNGNNKQQYLPNCD